MKFKDHGDYLRLSLEKCGNLKFDDNSRHGVRVDIHQRETDGVPQADAAFILNADDAIVLAQNLLNYASRARYGARDEKLD